MATMVALGYSAGTAVGLQAGAAGKATAWSPLTAATARSPAPPHPRREGPETLSPRPRRAPSSGTCCRSGPSPERINGRLAMVGFVAALSVMLASRGIGLLSQAESGAGLAWFATTAAVLCVASPVSLLQGESPDDRAGSVLNADAELWNDRFTMFGVVALAARH